ncbi:protein FAR1-RELATED SEQUENCE 5-like isoform X2 [Nymphaea colorata]|uniref:protein FAR1-RELATED SEQUENCE 5-like isoform X2 n=1 Tax=Nymphaea colorata TaxID=210225 RepID=UPI00129D6BFC|nr:protein FAR1-RELATED SEQUENCE 5-like isoform X2 [Nymphaea colorata]
MLLVKYRRWNNLRIVTGNGSAYWCPMPIALNGMADNSKESDHGSGEQHGCIGIFSEATSLAPKVGMEFDNEVQAFEFYNSYAYRHGFSVRINSWDKNCMGEINRKTFVCYKEGYAIKKGGTTRVRSDARCGCLARMVIKRGTNGRLYVSQFEPIHNHQVVAPSEVHMLRSHRRRAQADITPDATGSVKKKVKAAKENQSEIQKNLTNFPVDYKIYLSKKREISPKPGDIGSVMQYLEERTTNDPSFFSAIQLDQDDSITNIFWADARSKLDYDCFGDVVCFDTTLIANSSGRPFGLFIGINHHKQSVVFGATLLYDQSSETFEWLFQTFERTMQGKQPKVILTDQDQVIAKALANVWPSTYHRICLWHIFQKASNAFNSSNDFKNDFSSCIFGHEDEDSFLSSWQHMLVKHDLVQNEWLTDLFNEREKWALAYGRDKFCADIITTQRSESFISVLKRYLNSQLDLLRFLEHYERLVEDQRFAELDEDCKANEPSMLYTHLLREAAKVYTPNVFEIVRKEAMMVLDCDVDRLSEDGSITEYEVAFVQNVKKYIVAFDSSNCMVSCSCMKFDFIGILCCHALKVLDHMKIKHIPQHYILKRWTKDAKCGVIIAQFAPQTYGIVKSIMSTRYNLISHSLIKIATRASESEEAYKYLQNQSLMILEGVERILKKDSGRLAS